MRLLTDGQGAATDRYDYTPFGESLGAGVGTRAGTQGYTGGQLRHRFAGMTHDYTATTLEDTPWRKMDSKAGRWTTPDPYLGSMSVGDPQSFNRYAYVGNDPVNFVDPSGLEQKCVTLETGEEWCYDTDDAIDFPVWAPRWDPMQPLYDLMRGAGDRRVVMPEMPFNDGLVGDEGIILGPLRPDIRDRETFAVNSALSACGIGAGVGQYSNVNNGMWRGRNGNWYRMGWGGNGATGARSAAVSRASASASLGRAAFGVGAGFSFYQGVQAYQHGDNAGAAKSGVDIGMSGVGTFGGPKGAIVAGVYFGVDATVGWGRVLDAARSCDEAGRRVTDGRGLPITPSMVK